MHNSNEFQLYRVLLQLVAFAKELEFHIKMQYPLNEANISRAFVKKELPQKGELIHDGIPYAWHIHGNGISYHAEHLYFHYDKFPVNPLGITFHSKAVNDFIRQRNIVVGFKPEETDNLLQHLYARLILYKPMEEYALYALV